MKAAIGMWAMVFGYALMWSGYRKLNGKNEGVLVGLGFVPPPADNASNSGGDSGAFAIPLPGLGVPGLPGSISIPLSSKTPATGGVSGMTI